MNHVIRIVALSAGAGACPLHAGADVLGWTASVRAAPGGGSFVDVFAVTDATDALLNVYGGSPGAPSGIFAGFVATTASGGFRQSAEPGMESWRPISNQGWNSRDSFLTIGGGYATGSGAWIANASTLGDPGWLVGGEDTFSVPGVANANNVPLAAGWYLSGSASPARALVGLDRVASSSAEAAQGGFGMLVGHFYITDPGTSLVIWNMGASVRRQDGSLMQRESAFSFQVIPAPGVMALLAASVASVHPRRRRG